MHSSKLYPNIIVICGPTGIGKTSVSIKLAGIFNAEIISADSMQIFRHMDIGTAKPARTEMASVKHHMVDILEPDEHFDAAMFAGKARKIIIGLHKDGILPFVVGGTGLYIKALVHGLFQAEEIDSRIRARLKEEETLHGTSFLYNRLKEYDPATAERIHPNDTFRIIRALEIFEATGERISKYHKKHRFADVPFNVLKIGIRLDRDILYDRINRRVDAMIDAGFVDEVKRLVGMGFTEELQSMKSIGYRHIIDFIEKRISWDETLRTMKRDTRRYAKRQMTWFRADPDISWIDKGRVKDMEMLIKQFLSSRVIG